MNPYAVLGVRTDATDEEIKKAYRSKAKALHPDAGGSEADFQELNKANAILTDPARRARFDQHGDTEEPVAPPDPDAPAWHIIAQLLETCLTMQQDNTENDLITGMKNGVDQAVNQIKMNLSANREAKRRAEKMMKRFTRRVALSEGTADKLLRMLQWRLDALNEQIKRLEAEIPHHLRAKAILDDYRYEFAPPRQQFIFQSATSSTWGSQ